jgi:hypothetical protein
MGDTVLLWTSVAILAANIIVVAIAIANSRRQ